MAELVVIGYPDEATAERAYETTMDLQREFIVDLASAAVVTRGNDGRIRVETPTGSTAAGAVGGAFWGALFGLLFFMPLGGLVFGGIIGGLIGKLGDLGIKESFRERIQNTVKPGMSALVLIYRKITPDKALEALAPLGGEVLKTSLSAEAEQELEEALQQRSATAAR
jgi:uncharacterized membrane protein